MYIAEKVSPAFAGGAPAKQIHYHPKTDSAGQRGADRNVLHHRLKMQVVKRLSPTPEGNARPAQRYIDHQRTMPTLSQRLRRPPTEISADS